MLDTAVISMHEKKVFGRLCTLKLRTKLKINCIELINKVVQARFTCVFHIFFLFNSENDVIDDMSMEMFLCMLLLRLFVGKFGILICKVDRKNLDYETVGKYI